MLADGSVEVKFFFVDQAGVSGGNGGQQLAPF